MSPTAALPKLMFDRSSAIESTGLMSMSTAAFCETPPVGGGADPHVAAWRNYWKRVGKDTRTGIWHETYLVRAGEYEAIYGNMPPHGLGKASSLVPMADATSARARLRRRTVA